MDSINRRPADGSVIRARRLRKEMTVAERRLWQVLRKLNLNIRRQAPIGEYVADFACHAARLVIEIDGYHHTTPDGMRRDGDRSAWLNSRGYRVIRFDEKDARERTLEVAARIRLEIIGRINLQT